MALAGISGTDELAARLNLPKLSGRTLRDHIKAGDLTRLYLEPIARECGLPYEWFTVDIPAAIAGGSPADLPARNTIRIDHLEATVNAILKVLEATPRPAEDANGGPSLADLLPADFRQPEPPELRRAQ